jgi:hypothetical protein
MGELRPKGGELSPKPAALSFQDERARLEWPRRRTPPCKRMQETARRDKDKNEVGGEEDNEEQACLGECSQHQWLGPAGLPKSVEEV